MFDDFLVRALLAGIGLALVTGPAGCFIVWRRLAYFGETIAHSALLGVALAIIIDFDLTIGIFVTASVIVLAMFYLERRDTLPTDTLLGLLAHGSLALGLVTLSFFPNMRVDLQALLFGDILAVSGIDLAVIWIGGVLALGVLCLIWRPLLAATVSPDLAKVAGMNPERARLIFGIFLAAVIAAAIKVVGVLLIMWMSLSKTEGWMEAVGGLVNPLHSFMTIILGTSSIVLVGVLASRLFSKPQTNGS